MSLPLPGRTLPLPRQTFRALRHRDFRLLWLGLLVSLVGGWMQSVARGWLVLRLSDSEFQLGLVGFCTFLPVLLFALPAGVAADRLPRRPMLLWTQSMAMAMSLLLAWLTWTDRVTVPWIALIAFGMGTVGAFDIPVRQSLLKDLVGRDDLPNAIALNSLAFNGARMLGPAIAGLMLASVGEEWVFLVNGVSYLGILAGVLVMRHRDGSPTARDSWLQELRDGLAYARGEPRTRTILALGVVSSVFAFPYTILLPVFARDVLSIGSSGLGGLTAATGVGAIGGALFLAGREGMLRPGRTIAVAFCTLGAALIGFALSTDVRLSAAMLVIVGFAMIVNVATSNTTLQLIAPEALRGRVVSLYMLCFLGMTPAGSLLAGAVATEIGAPRTLAGGGAVVMIVAIWFATRIPALRRTVARSREASAAPNASTPAP